MRNCNSKPNHTVYTKTDLDPNSDPNPNPKPNPNPSSESGQFFRIEGDSMAHGELTAAVIESE